jgi:hypothetical protein
MALPEQSFSNVVAGLEGWVESKHFLNAIEMQGCFLDVLTHNL